MYTFRNGDTRCGEWDCGTLKNPQPPLTGVVLHAVQVHVLNLVIGCYTSHVIVFQSSGLNMVFFPFIFFFFPVQSF